MVSIGKYNLCLYLCPPPILLFGSNDSGLSCSLSKYSYIGVYYLYLYLSLVKASHFISTSLSEVQLHHSPAKRASHLPRQMLNIVYFATDDRPYSFLFLFFFLSLPASFVVCLALHLARHSLTTVDFFPHKMCDCTHCVMNSLFQPHLLPALWLRFLSSRHIYSKSKQSSKFQWWWNIIAIFLNKNSSSLNLFFFLFLSLTVNHTIARWKWLMKWLLLYTFHCNEGDFTNYHTFHPQSMVSEMLLLFVFHHLRSHYDGREGKKKKRNKDQWVKQKEKKDWDNCLFFLSLTLLAWFTRRCNLPSVTAIKQGKHNLILALPSASLPSLWVRAASRKKERKKETSRATRNSEMWRTNLQAWLSLPHRTNVMCTSMNIIAFTMTVCLHSN